jgi:hypothetical protein
MVRKTQTQKKVKIMTRETEIIKTTHEPTRKDLIFAQPTFFCFFCLRSIGTFGFAIRTNLPFSKPKEPIFYQPDRDL